MGLLERSYPQMERAIRYCHAASWAGVQSLGLGLLDPEELVRLTVRRFESSSYLDPAYNSGSGLWLWEREALRRFFPSAGSILVGAAGAGREMICFHPAGCSGVGFECARTMVEAGQAILRDAGCEGRLIWAPAGTAPEIEGQFDGAIMGWSGYMYIPQRTQRVKLLQDFRRLLRRGAPLLLSFQTREERERRMYWSARGANWIRESFGAPRRPPRATVWITASNTGSIATMSPEKWPKLDCGWSGMESMATVGLWEPGMKRVQDARIRLLARRCPPVLEAGIAASSSRRAGLGQNPRSHRPPRGHRILYRNVRRIRRCATAFRQAARYESHAERGVGRDTGFVRKPGHLGIISLKGPVLGRLLLHGDEALKNSSDTRPVRPSWRRDPRQARLGRRRLPFHIGPALARGRAHACGIPSGSFLSAIRAAE